MCSPSILASNRDELFSRPTDRLHCWPKESVKTETNKNDLLHEKSDENSFTLIAGKDRKAGGTWLGINQRGWLAAVTNIRQRPEDSDPVKAANLRSRGDLVLRILSSYNDEKAESLLDRMKLLMAETSGCGEEYSAFNLLACDLTATRPEMLYYSNRCQARMPSSVSTTDSNSGIGGLSNSTLVEADSWPKVIDGKNRLASIIAQSAADTDSKTQIVDALFAMLGDRRQPLFADQILPVNTGLPLEFERQLSTIFVRPIQRNQQQYGTRSSTIVLVDRHGQIDMYEKVYSIENDDANSIHVASGGQDILHFAFKVK